MYTPEGNKNLFIRLFQNNQRPTQRFHIQSQDLLRCKNGKWNFWKTPLNQRHKTGTHLSLQPYNICFKMIPVHNSKSKFCAWLFKNKNHFKFG